MTSFQRSAEEMEKRYKEMQIQRDLLEKDLSLVSKKVLTYILYIHKLTCGTTRLRSMRMSCKLFKTCPRSVWWFAFIDHFVFTLYVLYL
jgi:hypothetical protein